MALNDDGMLSSVRAINLKAWNNRWSVHRWSRCIKPFLSCIPDSQFADVLFEDVTSTCLPNTRMLACLKHSLLCKSISLASVINKMTTLSHSSQPFCLLSLINFLFQIFNPLVQRWQDEITLDVGRSWLRLLSWLLQILRHSTNTLCHLSISTSNTGEEDKQMELIQSSHNLLKTIISNAHLHSLISLSLHKESSERSCEKLFEKVNMNFSEIRTCISQHATLNPQVVCILEDVMKLHETLQTRSHEKDIMVTSPMKQHPLNITINFLVVAEACLYPQNHPRLIVKKLLAVEQMQNLSRAELCSEVVRSSFISLLHTNISSHDVKWTAFIYVKIPLLFKALSTVPSSSSSSSLSASSSSSLSASSHLFYETFSILLQYTALLDAVDAKCSSDCLQFLLNEVGNKHVLMNETVTKKIMTKRHTHSRRRNATQDASQLNNEPAYLILRAEPTVNSILMSLDTSKNQELMLGVMSQMLSGKSFQLISAAAASTHRLTDFVSKLIKINECATQYLYGEKTVLVKQSETSKSACIRATLFDISFLMLCHTIQFYQLDIISTCFDSSSTFFYQWALHSLPRYGQFKEPIIPTKTHEDQVETLLIKFSSPANVLTSNTKWDEVCSLMPAMLLEAMSGMQENESSVQEAIKNMLDCMKIPVCSLSVTSAVWLCNSIHLANTARQHNCMKLLQQLQDYKSSDNNTYNYTERSELARSFINYLFQQLCLTQPHMPTIPQILSNPTTIIPTTIIPTITNQSTTNFSTTYLQPTNLLKSITSDNAAFSASIHFRSSLISSFHEILKNNCILLQHLSNIQSVFRLNAHECIVQVVVKEWLRYESEDMLDKAVMLTHSISLFHMPSFTTNLLQNLVTNTLLHPSEQNRLLLEPWSGCLIKLCLCSISFLIHTTEESKWKRKNNEEYGKDMCKKIMVHNELDNPSKVLEIQESSTDLTSFTMENECKYGGDDNKNQLSQSLGKLFELFEEVLTRTTVGKEGKWVLGFMVRSLELPESVCVFIFQHASHSLIMALIRHSHQLLTPHHLAIFNQCNSNLNTQATYLCQLKQMQSLALQSYIF